MRFPLNPLAFAAIASLLAVGPALAESPSLPRVDGFPERPISVIVPYGAGGGSDQLSRAWARSLETVTGTSVQVINKPGGGGLAAVPDFMTAAKDGYTVLQSIDDAVTNFASGRLREDPAHDWYPLCLTQITFNQLYVRGDDDRFPDWASVLDYAKANPGRLTVANVGNLGSMERVNMLQLEEQLAFQTNQIAFDKPAERYAAVVGGQIDLLFEQPGDVRGFLDAGKLRPVLTFLDTRPSAFADTPTHREAGADFDALLRFRGFWTHPDVPAERRTYLEAACASAFSESSYQAFNEAKYMTLIQSFRDHDGAVDLLDRSAAAYRDIYKKIGLTQ
jgi:tripartite-type tricarboxylate transporter receptor subunit TctC